MTHRFGRLAGAASIGLIAASLLAGCVSATPAPPGITAAQRRDATEQNLAMLWAGVTGGQPGLVAPRVAIVKYTNYLDGPQTVAACLNRSGYPDTIVTPSLEVVDPAQQRSQEYPFDVARYVCEAKYPRDPLELGYLSDAQEAFLYTYWQNDTVPCLRALGVTVSNLPPIGQFGEGYEDVGNMNPFGHLKFTVARPAALLMNQCPPYPGELYPGSDG